MRRVFRGAFTALSLPETTPPFLAVCQIPALSEGKPDEALSMLGRVDSLDINSRSPHLFEREHSPLLRIKMLKYGSFRISFLQKLIHGYEKKWKEITHFSILHTLHLLSLHSLVLISSLLAGYD